MFDWLVEDRCILKSVWWYTWFHPNEEETMNGNRGMKGVYSKHSSRSESINVRRSEYENRRSLYKSLVDELTVYLWNALNIDKHEKRVWGGMGSLNNKQGYQSFFDRKRSLLIRFSLHVPPKHRIQCLDVPPFLPTISVTCYRKLQSSKRWCSIRACCRRITVSNRWNVPPKLRNTRNLSMILTIVCCSHGVDI